MKRPERFPRALLSAGPLMLAFYSLTGAVGYYYRGTEGRQDLAFLLDVLPSGGAKVLANVLMLVHIVVSYVIQQQVLGRAVHLWLLPSTAGENSARGKAHWFAITLGMLATATLLANSIPFFENFTGIIGAACMAPICLMLPCAYYLRAARVSGTSIHAAERLLLWAIIVFGAFLVVVGLVANISSTIAQSSTYGAPFQCAHSATPAPTPAP